MNKLPPALPFCEIGCMKIYTNSLLVEPDIVEKEIQLTLRDRWLTPILHPATVPFEPWRRTKVVVIHGSKPSRKILHTADGCLIMHPIMLAEIKRAIEQQSEA